MSLPFAQLSFPELYEQEIVGPLFQPFAELTMDEVKLAAGESLLDVACGTGIVARIAHERLIERATIVGVDISAPMIGVARRIAPSIDWREGDAIALPIRDNESFDVVTCQQGLQFVADRAAAVKEMRRALKPGGRIAVSTWRSDDDFPFVRELRRIAEQHLGPITDRRHGFSDASALAGLFTDAGFGEVRSKTLSRTVRFANGSTYARLNAMALLGMTAMSKASESERGSVMAAIARDSEPVVARHSDANGCAFEIATNFVTARTNSLL